MINGIITFNVNIRVPFMQFTLLVVYSVLCNVYFMILASVGGGGENKNASLLKSNVICFSKLIYLSYQHNRLILLSSEVMFF